MTSLKKHFFKYIYHYRDKEDIKIVPEDEGNQSQDDAAVELLEEDLKSPKIPDYSHLPPDPVQRDIVEGTPKIFWYIDVESNLVVSVKMQIYTRAKNHNF